jgi:NADH:ubiquinone oxidoreductase subunit 4 (subunit M)
MNLLVIPILFNDAAGEVIVALFVATHCILSSLLFFYIDVVTKRFATRATSQITGLTHVMPTFGAVMFAT